MKLQEFYKLLCVIYAKQIHLIERYKHLYDYIDYEKTRIYNDIEDDVFMAIAIASSIEKAIFKNLPELIQYHENWHTKIKEDGRNTRKESARYRFFYIQTNFCLCTAQNNCKKCRSYKLCSLIKKRGRNLK